mgnify:CR=1 FL=1
MNDLRTGKFHYETLEFSSSLLKDDFYKMKDGLDKLIQKDVESAKGEFYYNVGYKTKIAYVTDSNASNDGNNSVQRNNLKKIFKYLTDKNFNNSMAETGSFNNTFLKPSSIHI